MSYRFAVEEDEAYHLTENEFKTLLDGYFLARALQDYYVSNAKEIQEAQSNYKNSYALEVGIENSSTYTWEDMLKNEAYQFARK